MALLDPLSREDIHIQSQLCDWSTQLSLEMKCGEGPLPKGFNFSNVKGLRIGKENIFCLTGDGVNQNSVLCSTSYIIL